MDPRRSLMAAALCASALAVSVTGSAAPITDSTAQNVKISVFSSGLNNPRGLKFGPDGNLYVAEGGVGGTQLPPDNPKCFVVPPVGPYHGSATGSRISRIDANGKRTTVVDHLPSSQTSPALGSLVSGVADIAFIGNTMYAILSGAGCSHGVPTVPNSVIRIHRDGTWNVVVNLGAYQRANPVKHPEPDDFEPDGTWYSMIAQGGALYAVEPNHGEVVRVTTNDRQIERVADVSASLGHIVPTALSSNRGLFYFGNLGTFPQNARSSRVWTLTPSGQINLVASGFNMILGLAFDRLNRMYVLQASEAPAPTPGTGSIVKISFNGQRHTIADGLFFPTGMTFGPDGALYVSNIGFGPPPSGMGQVLKIEFAD
jgi:hypothetical protein